MKCLKSFQFVTQTTASISGADIDTWGVAPNIFWTGTKFGTSTFNFQGFKNVNVYSVKAIGDVTVQQGTGKAAIVTDWAFFVQINGRFPLASGNINSAPNDFSIQIGQSPLNMVLSRYETEWGFTEPVQSVSSIQIGGIRVSGIGAENLTGVDLAWNMTFVVNYLYEGEDE